MEDAERQRLPAAEVREAAQALSARLVESGPALSPDAGVAETLSSGKAKALRPESPPEPARKEIPIAQAARSDTEPASPVTTSASVALASSGGRQDQSPAVSAVQAAQASAEAPASPPPSPAPLQTADSVAAGDTTTAPVTPAPTFKDGTWSGWGSSRHGEIQVTVEIEDGRITSARITACQTRWSCRWVEHLQGQVVARQSAEVDYVSGATQSGNAFYFAAVAALAKAR